MNRTAVTVSNDIIDIIPRLFDGTLTTILNEVCQNSRRAGAGYLAATTHRLDNHSYRIQLFDDGVGMGEDINNLITLRKTGWDADTVANEDPAGMGFFSLFPAKSILVVSSKDGKSFVSLRGQTGSFGAVGFEIEPSTEEEIERWKHEHTLCVNDRRRQAWESCDAPPQHGTLLVFDIAANEAVTAAVHNALAWSGIPYLYCDECVLVDCTYAAHARRLIADDKADDIVGVVTDGDSQFSDVCVVHQQSFGEVRSMAWVSFYGIIIEIPAWIMGMLPKGYAFKVDVRGGDHFRLVLPARNALALSGDEVPRICEYLQMCLLRALTTSERPHDLPYDVYKLGQKNGLAIAEAQRRLRSLTSDPGSSYVAKPHYAATHALREYVAFFPTLCGVTGSSDSRFAGYPWYDSTPTILEATATVVREGEEFDITQGMDMAATEVCEIGGLVLCVLPSRVNLKFKIDRSGASDDYAESFTSEFYVVSQETSAGLRAHDGNNGASSFTWGVAEEVKDYTREELKGLAERMSCYIDRATSLISLPSANYLQERALAVKERTRDILFLLTHWISGEEEATRAQLEETFRVAAVQSGFPKEYSAQLSFDRFRGAALTLKPITHPIELLFQLRTDKSFRSVTVAEATPEQRARIVANMSAVSPIEYDEAQPNYVYFCGGTADPALIYEGLKGLEPKEMSADYAPATNAFVRLYLWL